MKNLQQYLLNLQSKVFKLLPMRETNDLGVDVHLGEYLNNLCINISGAIDCNPELENYKEFVDARYNISYLKGNLDIDFVKWRTIVLRTTRLLGDAASKS